MRTFMAAKQACEIEKWVHAKFNTNMHRVQVLNFVRNLEPKPDSFNAMMERLKKIDKYQLENEFPPILQRKLQDLVKKFHQEQQPKCLGPPGSATGTSMDSVTTSGQLEEEHMFATANNEPSRTDHSLSTTHEALRVADALLTTVQMIPGLYSPCNTLREIIHDVQEAGRKSRDLQSLGERASELIPILIEIWDHKNSISSNTQMIDKKLAELEDAIGAMKKLVNKYGQNGFISHILCSQVSDRATTLDGRIKTLLSDIYNELRMVEHKELRSMLSAYPLQIKCTQLVESIIQKGFSEEQAFQQIVNDQGCLKCIMDESGVPDHVFQSEMTLIKTELEALGTILTSVNAQVGVIESAVLGSDALFMSIVGVPTNNYDYIDKKYCTKHPTTQINHMFRSFSHLHQSTLLQNETVPIAFADNLDHISEVTLSMVVCTPGFGSHTSIIDGNVHGAKHGDTDLFIDSIITKLKCLTPEKRPRFVFMCCRYGSLPAARKVQMRTQNIFVVAVGMNLLDNPEEGIKILMKVILPSIKRNSFFSVQPILSLEHRLMSSLMVLSELNGVEKTLFKTVVENVPLVSPNWQPSQQGKNNPLILKSDYDQSMMHLFETWGMKDDLLSSKLLKHEEGIVNDTVDRLLAGSNSFFAIVPGDPQEDEDVYRCRSVALQVCKRLIIKGGCDAVHLTGLETNPELKEILSKIQLRKLLIWVDLTMPPPQQLVDWINQLEGEPVPGRQLMLVMSSEDDQIRNNIKEMPFFEETVCTSVELTDAVYVESGEMVHEEFKLCVTTPHTNAKTDIQKLFHEQGDLHLDISRCLPQNCLVVSIYDESNNVLIVRVSIRNVQMLLLFRDSLLSGMFQEKFSKLLFETFKINYGVNVDRTHIVEMCEKSVFGRDILTPHQSQAKKQCIGQRFVRIEGIAGTGKTVIGSHLLRDVLLKDRGTVLLCVPTKALGKEIGQWLWRQFSRFGLKGTSVKNDLLSRLHLLCNLHNSFLTHKLRYENGKILCEKGYQLTADTYRMVMIDEAHQWYHDEHLRNVIEKINAEHWLLLSDLSQSPINEVFYHKDEMVVHLTQVVRNSSRIVAGARSFQCKINSSQVSCLQDESHAPPLLSHIFNHDDQQGDIVPKYVEEVMRAIDHIDGSFSDLNMHKRLAIIVPDSTVLNQMKQPLQNALKACSDHKNQFVLRDADECCGIVDGGQPQSTHILFDEISNLSGLERLIVIFVRFDQPITSDHFRNNRTRSMIYRAMTRGHWMVIAVNHLVLGGWLEQLLLLKPADRTKMFDLQQAMRQVDIDAVESITRDPPQKVILDCPNTLERDDSEKVLGAAEQITFEAKEQNEPQETINQEIWASLVAPANRFSKTKGFSSFKKLESSENISIEEEPHNESTEIFLHSDGMTELAKAVQDGNLEMVSDLLNAGADPNIKDEIGWAPIYHAISNNHCEIAKLLINNPNCNINVATQSKITPVHYAIMKGNLEIVKALIERNCDSGWTPLVLAAKMNKANIVELILKIPDVRVTERKTALESARQSNHEDCIKILEEPVNMV